MNTRDAEDDVEGASVAPTGDAPDRLPVRRKVTRQSLKEDLHRSRRELFLSDYLETQSLRDETRKYSRRNRRSDESEVSEDETINDTETLEGREEDEATEVEEEDEGEEEEEEGSTARSSRRGSTGTTTTAKTKSKKVHDVRQKETKPRKKRKDAGKDATTHGDETASLATESKVADANNARVFDMREVFPVDDSHEPSVRELAKLSAYMHTMSRHFNLLELMGYVTTWFAVGRSLVRVNDQEYKAKVMEFYDSQVKCTCFLFEIIQRLHQAAYAVFRHSIEHIRSTLIHHSDVTCLLPPMADALDTVTALNLSQLRTILLTITEMCRMALREFHPAWKDMLSALETVPSALLRDEIQFKYSARHTAVLGTIATHLLQAHVVVSKWDSHEVPREQTLRLAWETAAVLAQIQDSVLVSASVRAMFPYHELLSQLRLLVFKRRMEMCKTDQMWAHVVWLAENVHAIAPGDSANISAWEEAAHCAVVTQEAALAKEDMSAIIELHKEAVQRRAITTEQIQVMDHNAMSSVYREYAAKEHGRQYLAKLLQLPDVRLHVIRHDG